MFQYTVYRKKCAARFTVGSGFVGFEAANIIPETVNNENPNYDWENKIIISLTVDEICKFMGLFDGVVPEISLFHSGSKGTKTLKAKKMDNGNTLISVDHTLPDGTKNSVSGISLTFENYYAFRTILSEGILSLTHVQNKGA